MTYLINCFILLIPILLWNLLLTHKLPRSFTNRGTQHKAAKFFNLLENILRVIVFMMTFLMKLNIDTTIQKVGLIIYIAGTCLYFLSWIPQIFFPRTSWSKSMIGSLAPAYTAIIWLVGIGLVGQDPFIRFNLLPWLFIGLSLLFIIAHTMNTYFVLKSGKQVEK